ncbi:MAG: glycoside hydrolase family 95 protein [Clostridiales bacterium]|nr:glycoside hydrolase family 95 protein [Clostridiales bacterium]
MLKPLTYKAPALKWVEALPIGNGNIGAMVFSGVKTEQLSLNESTFWSGYPRLYNKPFIYPNYLKVRQLMLDGDYLAAQKLLMDELTGEFTEAYMPLGDMRIDFADDDHSDFERSLDMKKALVESHYTKNGVKYTREAFASYPARAVVIKISADKEGAVSFELSMSSKLRYSTQAKDGLLLMHVKAPSHVEPSYRRFEEPIFYFDEPERQGMRALTAVKVSAKGGKVIVSDDKISVKDADSALIVLCARTSFNGYDKHPFLEGLDEEKLCLEDIKKLEGRSFDELYAQHLADHQKYFDRVDFSLDLPSGDATTLERLKNYDIEKGDTVLYEQLFAYGRYLLIASSRKGGQAANLQGIWNDQTCPPWSSNYTININTQMNYWPAELTNLSDMHSPLFELIDGLMHTGKDTARIIYGARGAVAHHNTDLWRLSNPVGEQLSGSSAYAFWPVGFAWLTRHLFEHYEYTLDKKFLRHKALPAIREAARFYIDTFIKVDGKYTFTPANSPENTFYMDGEVCAIANAAAMTNAVAREVLTNYIKICDILGLYESDLIKAHELLDNLRPLEIGRDGRLVEWDKTYDEVDPHHRHVSHLYALHPAGQITPESSPELLEACKKTLEMRGDDGTGWSMGWKINFWARLRDGDHALALIKRQLRFVDESGTRMTGGGTYANMFDAHPPFQIDGNFGACAGIAELFLQSDEKNIFILPALPKEWTAGHMNGLCAKNMVTCDIEFKNSALYRAVLTCKKDAGKVTVHFAGKAQEIELKRGETYVFEG